MTQTLIPAWTGGTLQPDDELGITGLDLEYRDRCEYRADGGVVLIEHEVGDVDVANVDEVPSMSLNPDEVMAARWVRYEALLDEVRSDPSRFTPWLRIYLDTYAPQIFGDLAASCVDPA